jgi:hypothetical protein
MTKRQAAWAAQHDWWSRTECDAPGQYRIVTRDGEHFSDYKQLRNWAGY